MVASKEREKAMKSITAKLAIIILSLLVSTHTFAFNQEQVCTAMNEPARPHAALGVEKAVVNL